MYASHGSFEGDFNPALLGFDEDIIKYCSEKGGGTLCHTISQPGSCSSCDAAGFSILNMFGHIPYNTCRNCALPPSVLLQCFHTRLLLLPRPPSDSAVEWQMCAIKGRLPGQGDLRLRFAQPPSELSINPNHGLFGQCSGYTGGRCDMPWIGFAAWSKCRRSQRPLRSPTAAEARALARGCSLGPGSPRRSDA